MDIVGILNGIKGKVLDATHFELLQSAYELQNNNVAQLKDNNSALAESNTLLKENAIRISRENEYLKAKVAELEAQLTASNPKEHASDLSEPALAILKFCLDSDITDFYADSMIGAIKYSRMQTESAIDELEQKELISASSIDPEGTNYCLTDSGKKYALSMG